MERKKSWFAEMVDRDLENFSGRIKEVISGFETFQKGGWGKGLSGRHLTKIIDRDESAFTTTWAELRQGYFREFSLKLSPWFSNVEVPLPMNVHGKIMSDKDIRKKVKNGFRLMFCPFISVIQLGDSQIIDRMRHDFGMNREMVFSEFTNNFRSNCPYWYWIDCSKKGMLFNRETSKSSPTLIEYLIADMVIEDELDHHLDNGQYIFIEHKSLDGRIMLGSKECEKALPSKISYFRRAFNKDERQFRISVRTTKIV